MSTYDSSHNGRRDRRSSWTAEEQRRAQEREARRAAREHRAQSRSVGASTLTMSGTNALGLSGRAAERPRGRGETARRVEESRRESIAARPAVYTQEPARPGLLERVRSVRLPRLALRAPSLPHVPTAVVVLAFVALAVAMVIGPARTYYAAWREAGILEAEYEALAQQNDELNHELERLQTLEGIEDEARARGYAYPDEEALVIDGIEEEQLADPALVDQAVADHEAGLPWYVRVLDVVLGYRHE